jgi:ketosteroid isomerase-like protein
MRPILFAAILALTFSLHAQIPASPTDAQAIRAVLEKSAVDWNRGDLDAFATSYKNSPDILFIGRTIHHGYADMLATYKSSYGTAAKRGTLTFSQLEVQPLDTRFATVTGHFHLERTAPGGGNANGYFLLVFEHTSSGWKIIRDDTTALPADQATDATAEPSH